MANPNIVAVASIYGESQGFNLSNTTTTTLIAAVSSGKLMKVNRITVANVDGSAANLAFLPETCPVFDFAGFYGHHIIVSWFLGFFVSWSLGSKVS